VNVLVFKVTLSLPESAGSGFPLFTNVAETAPPDTWMPFCFSTSATLSVFRWSQLSVFSSLYLYAFRSSSPKITVHYIQQMGPYTRVTWHSLEPEPQTTVQNSLPTIPQFLASTYMSVGFLKPARLKELVHYHILRYSYFLSCWPTFNIHYICTIL
jgi:hypothetical protein